MSNKLTVLIIRSNPCDPDPRVEKESKALSGIYNVRVLCWDRELKSKKRDIKDGIDIIRFGLKAPYGNLSLLFYLLIWGVYEFFWLLFARYDIIHACDFDTVLPAFFVSKIRRKKLIYDVFDFYADVLPFSERSFPYRAIKWLDVKIINNADAVILADESRKEQIFPARPNLLEFIYNSPPVIKLLDKRLEHNIKKDGIELFYAGILSCTRGLDMFIKVVSGFKGKIKLKIAGFGEEANRISNLAHSNRNVSFIGKITYNKVIDNSLKSDLLFATYDPKIRNHKYSSANKLFEAMMCHKPIIVAKNTGMDKIVDKENMGFIWNYGNYQELKSILELILLNKKVLVSKGLNAGTAYEKYSWKTMELRLLKLYNSILTK